jgi:tricorn protease
MFSRRAFPRHPTRPVPAHPAVRPVAEFRRDRAAGARQRRLMLNMFRVGRVAIALVSVSLAGLSAAQPAPEGPTRLLRFPATNGDQIVFSYAGQLYTVPAAGGTARRLTSGPGYAVFPRFSADGTQLAFTAQYDGNTEVYLMPAAGGTPKRLTYSATLDRDDLSDRMGPNNIVMAWKNKTPEIAFRSRWRSFDPFIGELYTVKADAEVPAKLPVPRGGFLSFSPDDTKIAYNRVFREFRTWKQYRGGMADDIWIFDLKTGALEDITNDPAQDIFPMWAPNGKIYFVSERTPRANLFCYDLATKQTKQLTDFKDYDVKFPSLGKGAIVFEQAGQIWRLDLATEKAAVVPITVLEDLAIARPRRQSVADFIENLSTSPDGQRVTVVARGDVFSVPAKDGPTRHLTQTSGVHERAAVWSPDGKWIAYLSDATGEFELYLQAQDGRSPAVQLTKDATSYDLDPVWSPDSKQLLWADRAQKLRTVDVATKAVTEIAYNPDAPIEEYAWSPDSQWIAWTRQQIGTVASIQLYSVASQKTVAATDPWYDARQPAFSDDGKWLLFASARDFHPIYSDTEWNHAYQNMQRVYLLALAKDTPSPFAPKSDEVEIASDDKKSDDAKSADDKKEKADDAKKVVVVKVDLDGLSGRTIGLPVEPSNYAALRCVDDKVYYVRTPGTPQGDAHGGEGFGGAGETKETLALFDLKAKKETALGHYDAYEITANGKKMLLHDGDDWAVIDLPTAPIEIKGDQKLKFSGLEMNLDRRAEWTQIFDESWRQMRDYFYAPNMHGRDWPAVRAKYGALLPWVATRNDLTYLIGEMIGELHIGHSYTGGGDRNPAPRIKMGLLGAEVSRDPASRAYRIDRILPGDNWQPQTRSPLTEIGVDVHEGDYILAVNGQPVADLPNLYAALAGTVGQQVVLRVNSKPVADGARDVTVVPIADEAPLYYDAWVNHNIDVVTKKTGGRVGYLHIPDMGVDGLNEFVRRFYPQLQKQALIVDVRGNGGGNVSPMIIERLRREMLFADVRRNGGTYPNPGDQIVGPKVLLCDEYSASDGDLVTYRFKASHLGKVIGKRTWGGVVGIDGSLRFTDGGQLFKPEFAPFAKDGKSWIIEGHGVDPDIVVDNDPTKELHGEDQQLDKAIEVILEDLKTQAVPMPKHPDWPVK